MGDQAVDRAAFARELEADLEGHPEERGAILLEAAHQWHLAGNDERATELLADVLSLGGEDRAFAQSAMAELLFEAGRDDEARPYLDALKQERPASILAYSLVGEMLEERGETKEALAWFTMAVARLTDEDLTEPGAARYWEGREALRGRLRIRQAMGFPPDELDEAAQDESLDLDPDLDPDLDGFDGFDGLWSNEMTVQFWPRDELVRAREVWPDLVQDDAVFREQEGVNRGLSASGVSRIRMVPLSVTRLTEFAAATGGDPSEAGTREAYLDKVVGEDGALTWPPPRNGPCWCGSGTKYKKCCGRPGTG
ncbi:SEC-C metal-binding domain-containing protein [Amycolatopsis minnesotensis]|uniref:SEC-C domain-containing protein n=1 Tax=Amycolatopsis minnesotensis TaxID=337894 RepID=A0ABN2R008_9PSEU